MYWEVYRGWCNTCYKTIFNDIVTAIDCYFTVKKKKKRREKMDALMDDVLWYSVHSTNRIDHYLKKNRLWNSVTQPTFEQFGIYYVLVNRYSGKHDEAINQIVIPNLQTKANNEIQSNTCTKLLVTPPP